VTSATDAVFIVPGSLWKASFFGWASFSPLDIFELYSFAASQGVRDKKQIPIVAPCLP